MLPNENAEPPGGQGRGASLPLQTLFHNIQLCQAWMGNARGSTGSIPRMPLEYPKRSCAESPASPTEVRMLQQCSVLHLPTSPSRSPLPLHPAQGLFPHPGTWRGLKAGANNGLNIVGGGRAAAAGCICPGHRAEKEACTCLAASLSAGNKSNKSPSVHP